MAGFVVRTIIAIVAAILLTTAGVAPAQAAEDGLITWSVKPADESGADGRSWAELGVDPGDILHEHLVVTNFSDTAVVFALSAADAYFTATGRFTMLPSSQPSRGPGTWIQMPEVVEVAADSTAVVPYTITVPEDATPGDNAAGVAASFFSSGSDGTGTQVGMESRVGFRVMMRVSGDLAPAFDVDPAAAAFNLSWNPFRPGSISVSYDFVNEGNTRLLVAGRVDASGRFAAEPLAAGEPEELLPGDVRRIEQSVSGVWPIGLVRVVVGADGTVTPGGEAAPRLERELWVWAVPWPQLILISGAALLVGAFAWRRRRRRVGIERLIEEARRETAAAVREELQTAER